MRIPYAVQGLILVPAFIALIFLLKSFCPVSGGVCFADYFAVPVFLPLIAVYKISGAQFLAAGHEMLFVLLYWAMVGFLIGLTLDLYTRPSQYSPEQRPPL